MWLFFTVSPLPPHTDNLPLSTARPAPPTSRPPSISVTYTVADGVNNTFSDSISVTVPQGSVFFKVMEAAQKRDPSKFRYVLGLATQHPSLVAVAAAESRLDRSIGLLEQQRFKKQRGRRWVAWVR
ncbi:hypothetical protein G0U57_007974 [Chelydra serpentina]|uniref:Uncharacterized protein n=1 Tax=Chelydra serpentina TaxID=8475 RepID=A0A8T1RYQ7_CHESE|nr:hypothetical protein G0U57_007974 [Chelydra serpentina]